MSHHQEKFVLSFLSPRYWLTWVGLGLLRICAHMPHRLQWWLGHKLGILIYYCGKRRRHITKTNIALCFPHLSEEQQIRLVKESFAANATGLLEIATGWWAKAQWVVEHTNFIGLEHIQQAQAQGRGVLLVGAHFTTLDLAGYLLGQQIDVEVIYMKHKNPVFDYIMRKGRLRNFTDVIERKDIRKIFRHLKEGRTVWYAPDQDYGVKHSVFAPFFGIDAATVKFTPRFAAYNKSPVLFFRHHRNADGSGYTLEISPPLDNYPTGDDQQDATRINQMIEENILKQPEQYLWMHRRFKSRPSNQPSFY